MNLLVKPKLILKSQSLIKHTNIIIMNDGVEYLGGVIGSDEFVSSVLKRKAQVWKEEIASLAEVATDTCCLGCFLPWHLQVAVLFPHPQPLSMIYQH